MTDTIDVPSTTALAPVTRPPELPLTAREAAKSDAKENRTVNVNEALQPAYQKASTLQLTKDERDTLTALFPDEAVERRPHDGLLYIPHIEISDRLCQVFGPGQWCTVRRREWIEGTRIYAEWVLLIRGCFVGESVGAMDYHPNNPKMNYSDALEGTRGECIRRIAAKELGCGSQVWRPSYCRAWEARNPRGGSRQAPAPAKTPPRATGATSKAAPAATAGAGKPFKSKADLVRILSANREAAVAVLRLNGVLLDTETLDDIPEHKLPQNALEMNALLVAISNYVDNSKGEPQDDDPQNEFEIDPGPEPAWKSHKFHFGPHNGKTLGEVASANSRNFFGWAKNYNPGVDREGKPKQPSPEDMMLRDALDEALKYMEARK